MTAKFFSPQWCAQALSAENAASAEIISGFKEAPPSRTYWPCEVSDRPDVVCHLKYEEGRCVAWATDLYPEDDGVGSVSPRPGSSGGRRLGLAHGQQTDDESER